MFEAACQRQHAFVGVSATNNLEADGKLVDGEASRNRDGGMPCEIDWEGHAPANERINAVAVDLGWTDCVAIRGVRDRRNSERGRYDKVVVLEHACKPS